MGLSLDVFVQQKGVSQEDSPSIPFHPFASSSFSQTVDKDVQCFGEKVSGSTSRSEEKPQTLGGGTVLQRATQQGHIGYCYTR